MSEWHTGDCDLPDFRTEGFHTGLKVIFRLSDGREIEDIYQGWGIFGTGRGFDWLGGTPHVVAWKPCSSDQPPVILDSDQS